MNCWWNSIYKNVIDLTKLLHIFIDLLHIFIYFAYIFNATEKVFRFAAQNRAAKFKLFFHFSSLLFLFFEEFWSM